MTKSEYIVWKCESMEQIREEHPDWTEAMVRAWLGMVQEILEKQGFFN